MTKKAPIAKYTSRDFNSIKNELVEYSKRYYPNTFSDFNKSSFGSLMLDTVSYVGDVLSFYLDYQFNESFLNTASEFDNVLKIANQLGYKYSTRSTAFGELTMYISVPANSTSTGPDLNYLPILRKGSTFGSTGGQLFTLMQDVNFAESTNEIVVANVDTSSGVPTRYAIKTKGMVQSGFYTQLQITVGNFERFRKIDLNDSDVLEVVSVVDSDGNQYYEVDHLSQDVIYRQLPNFNFQSDGVESLLKPFPVPRRFMLNKSRTTTVLQFGYGSEDELTTNSVVDPAQTVLQMHAKDYFSDTAFDPTNLIKSDKFGVAPSNTTLTITYRKANAGISNVAASTITKVTIPNFLFSDVTNTLSSERSTVIKSLEVVNENSFTGEIRLDQTEELRNNTMSYYAAQNRAVSSLDYQALIYGMPSSFGRVKRCFITQDNNSFKRNINIYVLSENNNAQLTVANQALKENLKTWLVQYKMINDTIDILDAIIINVGIEFDVVASPDYDKADALNTALIALQLEFLNKQEIGESFSIAKIYNILNKLNSILDVRSVKITPKVGGVYSNSSLNLDKLLTYDGKYIKAPKNVIYEVKFPLIDIKGTIS
jgi:uncharacterized protein YaiI (UPF0178 family)